MKNQFLPISTLSRRSLLKWSMATSASALCSNFLEAPSMIIPIQRINTRTIPSSGEALPIVGIGTWQTFDVGNHATQRAELKKVLQTFVELGGQVMDSSPMYGTSEKVVGDLAADLGILDQLFMATKVWTNGEQAGIQQMDNSMQKMRRQPMDLMQVHNLLDFKTHIKTLQKWKAAGKIRYIGITHYLDNRHDEMAELIKKYPLDFIQINYSIQSRNAEKRLFPTAKDKGVAVLVNRPYEGGQLFRTIKNTALPLWAKEYDINSWGQYFLKFILSHPAITCVIPGTSKLKHLQDNMGAGLGNLPDKKGREKLATFLDNL